MKKQLKLVIIPAIVMLAVTLGVVFYPQEASAHGVPGYSIATMDVYESTSTVLNSGTAICTGISTTSGSGDCATDLVQGSTYRFEFVVNESIGDTSGTPNRFDMVSSVGTGDTLGATPGYTNSDGCFDTVSQTDWTAATSGADVQSSAGTACTVAKNGSAEYWMIITVGTDAGTGGTSSSFFITDGTQTDTSAAVTFNIVVAPAGPTYVVDLLTVYESESTTLGTGNTVCSAVDLETTPSTCNGTLEYGHAYRLEVTVRNDGASAGSPTSLEIDASVGDKDVFGTVTADAYGFSDSGCSTNADWTESISGGTDARAASGTTCSITSSGGTAVFWMVIRVNIDTGGVSPTATFTIDDGADSDVSTSTTFINSNILINGGGVY